MTTKRSGMVMALVVTVGLAGAPLEAQQGQGRMGGDPGPNIGRSLEAILANQEELELTGDQLRELESLKATLDKDVVPLAEEMKTLREQIWGGELDREDGFRQMQELRGKLMVASAPLQGRVQEILTVEQHRKIQLAMRENRPGGGRGGMAFQGRGGRGGMAFQGRGGMAFQGRGGMAFQGRGAGSFRGRRGMPFQGRGGFRGRGTGPQGLGVPQGNLSSPVR